MGSSISSVSGKALAASLSKSSIPLGCELSSFGLFSFSCVRSRELLERFLKILDPGGLH